MSPGDRVLELLPARHLGKVELAHGISSESEMHVRIHEPGVKDRPFSIQNASIGRGAESDPAMTQIDVDRLARLVQSHVSNAGKA